MINNLKPYPAMKGSGVESLGDVPEHWEIHQLGRVGHLFKGVGGTKEDEVPSGVPCVRYGDLYMQHQYFIRESRSRVSEQRAVDYTPIHYGDVLFAGSGETIEEIGKSAVNLISGHACCGGDVIIFRSQIEIDASFLGYVTDCPQAAHQKSCMGRGITVMHIYGDELKYMWVARPPLPEQAAIVRYLDHADRRIRRYIRAKQKLITLLEEQKQAIIHQAVTRGLDPNVRIKPSGVELRRDRPERQWKPIKIKYLSSLKGRLGWQGLKASEYTSEGPYVVSSAHFRDHRINWEICPHVTRERYEMDENIQLAQGDILLMKDGAAMGKLAFVDELPGLACLNSHLLLFRPLVNDQGPTYFPQFMFFYMQVECFQGYVQVNGTGATFLGISQESIGNHKVCLPSRAEQVAIVEHLDAATAAIDATIWSANSQIELFGEYRTRLIADVVTGKLDVREAAAGLPEIDPLADEFDAPIQAAETGVMELEDTTESPEEQAMENEATV